MPILFILLFSQTGNLSCQIPVLMGNADAQKPPLFFENGTKGLVLDLVEALNRIQKEFSFQLKTYPSQRLTLYAAQGDKIHIIMFSNLKWIGEAARNFKPSVRLMSSRDIYFSLKDEGRNQDFFDNVGKIATVGVQGYHYFYSGFVNDGIYLKNIYNTTLVKDELTVIQMILLGRGQIGIAENSSLEYFRGLNPDGYSRLLLSTQPDNVFDRVLLVNNDAPVSVEQMNNFIRTMKTQGVLDRMYSKYGLSSPSL